MEILNLMARVARKVCIWVATATTFAVMFWSQAAMAQSPVAVAGGKLQGAEAFFRDPDIAETVLSPNGKRLAITSSKGSGRRALYVVDVDNPGQFRSAAAFRDAEIVGVRWLDDERLLFSASDFSKGSGRQVGGQGLFMVGHDGRNMRDLIQRRTMTVVDGSNKSSGLDMNYRLLKVPDLQEGVANDEILVGQYHRTTDDGYTVSATWLNVKTGRTRATGFDAPRGVTAWIFDGRGEARVVSTREKDRQAAHWRAPGSTQWQQIVEGDLLEMPFTPHTVDNAGNLYVTRKEGAEGYKALVAYDFAAKAPAVNSVVSTPGFDFTGSLILERGSMAAQGVRVVTDGETTVWFDDELKRIQALVDARLPAHTNRISCRQCGKDDAVVLVRSFNDRDPGRLQLFRPTPQAGQAAWTSVGALRPEIEPLQMATVDFQRIKARDGREVPVWVTTPAGAVRGKPNPAVVLVHGGPWVRGSDWSWHAMSQFLASRGYLVIEPEFRGSVGYGDAHFKAGWKQWGLAMQDDVADALLWAQKQGIASNKACIAGASYGGYSTLMGLARQPQLYRCGAAWVAVTDLELLVKGSWWVSDDTSDVARKYTIPEMVGSMDKDAQLITANSPVLLADKIKAPLLLAFGEDDQRVPLAHGKRMRESLQKQGFEPEWVTYGGEGHGWGKLETRLDFAVRLERFLSQHLRTP
jgi:dipeptidyl aminopeptidase/acylaminoacyl peptidase